MNELTKEQLQMLTDAITERLLEFDLPAGKLPTKGVVRVAYEVIAAHLRGQMTPVREEAEDKRRPVTQESKPTAASNGVPNLVAAVLGPEHTTVTPLKNGASNGAHAEKDHLVELAGSELKAAQLREMIGELQMLSEKGEMPTMALWDERKPLHLPKATAAMQRYNLTWGRLAEYARLRFEGRRSTPERVTA